MVDYEGTFIGVNSGEYGGWSIMRVLSLQRYFFNIKATWIF